VLSFGLVCKYSIETAQRSQAVSTLHIHFSK